MEDEQLRSRVLQNIMKEMESGSVITDQHRSLCVVCLETISEHAVTDPCAHAFDFLCIINWLERTPTCPLCKTQVMSVHYSNASDHVPKIYTVPEHPKVPPGRETIGAASDQHQQELQEQQLQPNQPGERIPSSTPLFKDDPLSRRRLIYCRQLYSLHIGSNQVSRFQELTPKRFRRDNELISRARKWIRRELQVFDYLVHPSETTPQCESKAWWIGNPEYLLEWIIAMLKSVNIKGSSGQAEDMLQEFLGRDNARLFLHELRAWLRSPFHRVEDWDQHVQYNEML